MELITLKNNYAQEQGYEDWETFLNHYGGRHPEWFEQHWTEICIRVEKATLENYFQWHKEQGFVSHKPSDIDEFLTKPENLIR